MEKSLKFFSTWRCGSITFNPVLILLPTKKDFILEKKSYKKYVLMVFSFSYFEIVFALLIKVVIFHVQVSIIQIWILYLKGPVQNISSFLGHWRSEILPVFYIYLYELTKQIILWSSGSRLKVLSGTKNEVPNSRFSILDKRHSNNRKSEDKAESKDKVRGTSLSSKRVS